MAQGKVEICGVNTARLPLLGSAEQELLLKEIKEGNENARIQFIEGNLRLVLSVIRRFSASTENMDDLFQIGCIGLIKSIDNFDLTLGVKFSTYAVPMIMGEIRRYLRDSNSIRVSRSLKDIAYKAISAREAMTKQTQKEPTIDEIATEIGIAKEEQERVYERFYRVDKSHSRQTGGTGLGLSIVKHGAALHHAQIRTESQPGQGTTITVFLPRVERTIRLLPSSIPS